MKGTKVIQRGRSVYLSTQHLLLAFVTDWQGVLICIYLIKTMHNSFLKQEKTHASGKLFTHFLISTLLFESLRKGAGDFFLIQHVVSVYAGSFAHLLWGLFIYF